LKKIAASTVGELLMAKRLYMDTSAYLCILLGEAGHEKLCRETAGAELLSSVVLLLEALRNLIRLSREEILSTADFQRCVSALRNDMRQFHLRDLTLDICDSLTMPVISVPRSLVLAHLRTALWFHQQERLTGFLSLDGAQISSARELGLPV
jgi:hypothetical protein